MTKGRTGVGDLLNVRDILLGELEEHGDGGRLDGDSSILFVLSRVGGSSVSSSRSGDDTGLGEEGVGEGGLSVIDCEQEISLELSRVTGFKSAGEATDHVR